jgi:hypothetical protein
MVLVQVSEKLAAKTVPRHHRHPPT